MTIDRRPVAFGDMRGWMKALKTAGELHEIDSEVDWNVELGTITRMAQGPGTGPALLFSNIKDYNRNNTRCGAVFESLGRIFLKSVGDTNIQTYATLEL
jgi:4-hydroxy-3-polyprenylbenzoate decarboxylase